MNTSQKTYCGYVALVGRPNVGKSTLLNALMDSKVSITSKKPQTTRHRILGVSTEGNYQTLYIDTPGMHRGEKKQLNRYMNRSAQSALHDVDVILFLISAMQWKEDDAWILKQLESCTCPVILLINKVDRVTDKSLLLPFIETLNEKMPFAAVIPISATKGINLLESKKEMQKFLPESVFLFPEDMTTDRDLSFRVTELIREKLFRFLGQEVPYEITVTLDRMTQEKGVHHIYTTVWVNTLGQKKIIIGAAGETLKKIATLARLDIEKLVGGKVFLRVWCKVKKGWTDDANALQQFGYNDF